MTDQEAVVFFVAVIALAVLVGLYLTRKPQ